MDFSAPDKTRERPATPAEIAQKIASAEARAYRDGYDARSARQRRKTTAARRWRLRKSIGHSGHRDTVFRH